MKINIERWIGSMKVTVQDWYDDKSIYFCIEAYQPGQSISKGPAWSKSFLLPWSMEQTIRDYFSSVVDGLAAETDERKFLSYYSGGILRVQNGQRIY